MDIFLSIKENMHYYMRFCHFHNLLLSQFLAKYPAPTKPKYYPTLNICNIWNICNGTHSNTFLPELGLYSQFLHFFIANPLLSYHLLSNGLLYLRYLVITSSLIMAYFIFTFSSSLIYYWFFMNAFSPHYPLLFAICAICV